MFFILPPFLRYYVLAIVQVRTDIADEDDVEGEMKKVVSLVEPVCVIFPQSVLIIGQKGVFTLISDNVSEF